jgi:Tol biopolymer transport system component
MRRLSKGPCPSPLAVGSAWPLEERYTPFLKDQFDDDARVFSPDGRWPAYCSNATGRYELYVQAFPPPASEQGGQWQISNGGVNGESLYWSRSRPDLIYQSGDQLMAVK